MVPLGADASVEESLTAIAAGAVRHYQRFLGTVIRPMLGRLQSIVFCLLLGDKECRRLMRVAAMVAKTGSDRSISGMTNQGDRGVSEHCHNRRAVA
jgi:hypothetical protein